MDHLDAAIGAFVLGLLDDSPWRSLYIDYEPPTVERLYTDLGDGHRLLLHRIFPCEREQALYHGHPWPSAVRVLPGTWYRTDIGTKDKILSQMEGSGLSYVMDDPDAWHRVAPEEKPAYSFMLVGPLYDAAHRPAQPKIDKPLIPLSDERAAALLRHFKKCADVWVGFQE